MPRTKNDLLLVLAVYTAATAAGGAAVLLLREVPSLFALAAATTIGTLVVYAFSWWRSNASMYDAYWSVAPLLLVAALFWLEPNGDRMRQALVFAAITPWGVRLTWNWWRGWDGASHEDWRYRTLREKHGARFWLVNLFGIHLFPTALVFAGLLSAWAAFRIESAFAWYESAGLLICWGAALLQGVADNQLRRFRLSEPPREAVIEEGLWAWSRHPNYLGELGLWWGLATFAILAGAPLWVLIGPAAMTALFHFISIPMLEERMLARRPAYADTQRRISRLLPRPPRPRV